MSNIPEDVIQQLGTVQAQVWQTVSLTLSEAVGQSINFASPLTVAAKTSDLYAEIGQPMLVIQFAFAGMPENAQTMLIPQETAGDLATLIKGSAVGEIDENIVADLRPALEAIVQGVCLAVGNIKNDTVVASGLSIRFQIPSLPPNFQKAVELARTNVAISAEEMSGTVIWLMDADTVHHILGTAPAEEEEPLPTPSFGGLAPGPGVMDLGKPHAEESHSLDLLMDIPLEITVELGRVKMLVRDVVELGAGSIVEIDKAAGEPVDVMVNGRLVARGEVVVIEDNFGVRITEILNPHDRLNRLGDAA